MTKEEVIDIMIETVNAYNINLMRQSKMSEEDITKNIDSQYQALHYMFGMIYDDLDAKNAFN